MRQKRLNKMLVTLSVCAFLLCGCGKEEETVVETIAPTPEPVQSTIEVQIEPDVTIEEHKGNTDIHMEQEETIPAEAYETERRMQRRRQRKDYLILPQTIFVI